MTTLPAMLSLRTQQFPAASALIAGRSSKRSGPLNGPMISATPLGIAINDAAVARSGQRPRNRSIGFIHSSSWFFRKAISPRHASVSKICSRLSVLKFCPIACWSAASFSATSRLMRSRCSIRHPRLRVAPLALPIEQILEGVHEIDPQIGGLTSNC
jgi:hypothetical protein